MRPPPDRIRADKWLWHARFFKTRALAARTISGGHFRVDGVRVTRPARTLRPGMVLTFVQARRVRVVEVLALSSRRGPAPEARLLYRDLAPDSATQNPAHNPAQIPGPPPGHDGRGRPSGRDRRAREKFARRPLE